MDRRSFLRLASAAFGSAALTPLLGACSGDDRDRTAESALSVPGLLDGAASDAPIDTVVIVMLENRSFDHHLGWLGDDSAYIAAGRRAYGHGFNITAKQVQQYRKPDGRHESTYHLPSTGGPAGGYRGCDYRIPGHGWDTGRAQRDNGFLGRGTHNDTFAIGYYDDTDVAFYASLARRFTVADHHFSSLMGPTFPNRQYLHSATSQGDKSDPKHMDAGMYSHETIWDRLQAASVNARYYYVDTPWLALWGNRLFDRISPIDDYFADAAAGTLPNVVMVDPAFQGPDRADDHPHGDIRIGQRFVQSVFGALANSPQWSRSVFVLTYDEWGGFFDHVEPPVVPDHRESDDDDENFGQTGFRVPTIVASPYVRRGYVDPAVYDHTSILRFLEWRFLGAPAHGTAAPNGKWYLTKRDRFANNLGGSLVTTADGELDFDASAVLAAPTGGCPPPEKRANEGEAGPGDVPQTDAFKELTGTTFGPATETPWLN
ncbi:MAG: alkaline phosphatase family protein [Acidimicrobiia bacterium]